jgi:hypothetical protein
MATLSTFTRETAKSCKKEVWNDPDGGAAADCEAEPDFSDEASVSGVDAREDVLARL